MLFSNQKLNLISEVLCFRACSSDQLYGFIWNVDEIESVVHLVLMKTITGNCSEPFPKLVASISINNSMRFTARLKGAPLKILRSLPEERIISGFMQLCSVLKEISRLASPETVEELDYLTMAKDCLSEYLQLSQTQETADMTLADRIRFLREQLSLARKLPTQRRYSADLMKLSYLMHACSSQVLLKKIKFSFNFICH